MFWNFWSNTGCPQTFWKRFPRKEISLSDSKYKSSKKVRSGARTLIKIETFGSFSHNPTYLPSLISIFYLLLFSTWWQFIFHVTLKIGFCVLINEEVVRFDHWSCSILITCIGLTFSGGWRYWATASFSIKESTFLFSKRSHIKVLSSSLHAVV